MGGAPWERASSRERDAGAGVLASYLTRGEMQDQIRVASDNGPFSATKQDATVHEESYTKGSRPPGLRPQRGGTTGTQESVLVCGPFCQVTPVSLAGFIAPSLRTGGRGAMIRARVVLIAPDHPRTERAPTLQVAATVERHARTKE